MCSPDCKGDDGTFGRRRVSVDALVERLICNSINIIDYYYRWRSVISIKFDEVLSFCLILFSCGTIHIFIKFVLYVLCNKVIRYKKK